MHWNWDRCKVLTFKPVLWSSKKKFNRFQVLIFSFRFTVLSIAVSLSTIVQGISKRNDFVTILFERIWFLSWFKLNQASWLLFIKRAWWTMPSNWMWSKDSSKFIFVSRDIHSIREERNNDHWKVNATFAVSSAPKDNDDKCLSLKLFWAWKWQSN